MKIEDKTNKRGISRRQFLVRAGAIANLSMVGLTSCKSNIEKKGNSTSIKIKHVDSNFERESLIRPFGFKGIYQNEFWVSAALLESDSGIKHVGLMTQCLAWCDLDVFLAHSEAGGNLLLYQALEHVLQKIKGSTFRNPIELQETILDDTHKYGRKITENEKLRMTFTLSSLVALDNAAWMIYAQENGFKNFDEMIPEEFRPSISYRHKKIAHVPLMSYAIPLSEIEDAVNQGYFFMKIKIGRPGTQEDMLVPC